MQDVFHQVQRGQKDVGLHHSETPSSDNANPLRVRYINDLFKLHPVFDQHMRCEKLARVFLDLYRCDVCAFQSATVIKPAYANMEYLGWHQDAPDYIPLSNFKLSSALTYLSDMGPDSGGTSVVPRSHRWGIFERDYVQEEGSSVKRRIIAGLNMDEVEIESPQFHAGDVLIFHPCVIHKANSNTTSENKVGLINAYRATDCIDLTGRNEFKADNIFITLHGEPLVSVP